MKKVSLFIILTIFIFKYADGQGCSDAGFCTIGNLKGADTAHNVKKIRFGINPSLGIGGDENTSTFSVSGQVSIKISKNISFQNKLVYASASGDSGRTSSLGDIYSVLNFNLPSKKSNVGLSAGIKIPLNNSNAKGDDGSSLPLVYQTSLGTWDFIVGVAFSLFKKFEINAGLQYPFANHNRNEYLNLTNDGSRPPTTYNYDRKSDVLLRVGYPFNISKKLRLKPNIVSIYHLSNDTYTYNNVVTELEGSKGNTINFNAILSYQLPKGKGLEFSLAFPTKIRSTIPDGLRRRYVFSINYSF